MTSFPYAELIVALIFAVFVLTTVAGGLIAVLTSQVIRSVCGLAICSVGLAGLYYFLHSPFLALMEILIYIGAVCVTIAFAIMLAEPQEPPPDVRRGRGFLWGCLAVVVSGTIFWSLWRLPDRHQWSPVGERVNDGSVKEIGIALLTTYSMAFELISLVLLVAIVGAIAIARTGRNLPAEAPPKPAPSVVPPPAELVANSSPTETVNASR